MTDDKLPEKISLIRFSPWSSKEVYNLTESGLDAIVEELPKQGEEGYKTFEKLLDWTYAASVAISKIEELQECLDELKYLREIVDRFSKFDDDAETWAAAFEQYGEPELCESCESFFTSLAKVCPVCYPDEQHKLPATLEEFRCSQTTDKNSC